MSISIPKHWKLGALRYYSGQPIKNGVGEPGSFDDPLWPRYIRITDVAGPRKLKETTFASLPPDIAAAAPVSKGDILFAAVGATYGKSTLITEEIGPACYAGFMVRFNAGPRVLSEYVAYWSESKHYWDQVHMGTVQATIQNFSAGKYRSLRMPVPPLPEQRIIAAYLDRETARIDGLVERLERLIALLTEKRQATVSHAVTKGLDPSVPMKDSGIDWLGKVPAHWKERRLYTFAKFVQGKAHEPFFDDEGEYACATARFVSTGGDANRFSTENLTPAKPNDILMVMSDLPNGRALARAYLVSSGDSIAINQRVCGITILDGDPRYFAYQLNRHEELLRYNDGSNQTHPKNSYFTQLSLRFPPVSEQIAIADHLDSATAEIDHLTKMAGILIERTKERRAALISAAVTGQIPLSEMGHAPAEAAE